MQSMIINVEFAAQLVDYAAMKFGNMTMLNTSRGLKVSLPCVLHVIALNILEKQEMIQQKASLIMES